VAGPGYSPFIQIAGSDTIYNAPIVATGDGPFDVTHHTNTGDRVLAVHIAGPSAPGQFAESWVDMLFVKGFDAGQPIVYLSTDAGQPLTAVLERSTYVPALNDASCNGCDDFLGSARERLFCATTSLSHRDGPSNIDVTSMLQSKAEIGAIAGKGQRTSAESKVSGPAGPTCASVQLTNGIGAEPSRSPRPGDLENGRRRPPGFPLAGRSPQGHRRLTPYPGVELSPVACPAVAGTKSSS
jgi:hypothetical protein